MPESEDVVGALMARVSRARAAAERTIERSAVLVTARRAVANPHTMVKRCAWCQRLLLAGVWVPEDDIPDFVGRLLDGRTTHGICERCMRDLEESGRSRTRPQQLEERVPDR